MLPAWLICFFWDIFFDTRLSSLFHRNNSRYSSPTLQYSLACDHQLQHCLQDMLVIPGDTWWYSWTEQINQGQHNHLAHLDPLSIWGNPKSASTRPSDSGVSFASLIENSSPLVSCLTIGWLPLGFSQGASRWRCRWNPSGPETETKWWPQDPSQPVLMVMLYSCFEFFCAHYTSSLHFTTAFFDQLHSYSDWKMHLLTYYAVEKRWLE